jgi:2-iminobutanoate/2-iminopropanoate deaminase
MYNSFMKQTSTNSAPSANHILSQAILSGNLVFVSGQVHQQLDGALAGETVAEKLQLIMNNIKAILDSAGSGFDKVVKVTIWVTDMAQMTEINKLYPKYFPGTLPAREAICVTALPLGATIEISVTAEV